MYRTTVVPLLCLLLFWSVPSGAGSAGEPHDPAQTCGPLITAAEAQIGIPTGLLQAIARAESGRWAKSAGALRPWPWTVMAEGKGRFYPSRRAAVEAVAALQARGVRNIDVGCMQINLHFHGHAFASVDEAIDPVNNVAYAAIFLAELRTGARSWIRAAGQYHSRTPERLRAYRNRVLALWREVRQERAAARLAARRAARDPVAVHN